jgi:hypothetical protein
MKCFRSLYRSGAAGTLAALLSFTLGACSSSVEPDDGAPVDPGAPVRPEPSAEQQAELQAIEQAIEDCNALDAASFQAAHALPFAPALSYDPTTAEGLPLIQGSSLALGDEELAALSTHGFVISEDTRFPTFVYGYESIYAQDLPVYVSADSILYAVHRSYDAILTSIETASLIPELDELLAAMREKLSQGGASDLGAAARADADLYLAVGSSLLTGQPASPVAGASSAEVAALVAGAQAASGAREVDLFGVPRTVDFSQFKPRGHYTATEELSRYFRAMMWLGREDLRILETLPDHTQVFRRRQLEGAVALRELMNDPAIAGWKRVHGAIAGFVGEPDSMTPPEIDELLADLGAQDGAALAAIDDATIAQAIMAGGYGTQRIASHVMVNGLGAGTMPLSSSFLLFGQAYVIDSHVFSNVVYDRVQKGSQLRMMPDPLDVAFAALRNDQAAALLEPQLQKHSYSPDLCSMRAVSDAHGDAFWETSLYNLWLGSLRALSPDAGELGSPGAAGLASVATTEAWGRRVLGVQLASWAELRHDTLLYAKQSYTGGSTCEFPDAYVDPYPKFYAAVARFAEKGAAVVGELDLSGAEWLAPQIQGYFARLGDVAKTLEGMAEHQRTGTPFTQEQLDFVNRAVAVQLGCGDPAGAEGWYADLFYDVLKGVELDPTIADVHTQPTDEAGNEVGRVLHVGTGLPRAMVVTVETCSGPRAYAGLASSYFERVTEDWERLDDETWAAELEDATPADVPWMSDLVVR